MGLIQVDMAEPGLDGPGDRLWKAAGFSGGWIIPGGMIDTDGRETRGLGSLDGFYQ
jgi:hypothetical protein